MKRLADRLARARALRDDAWDVVRDDVSLMREDLEQRGVGKRITDRVTGTARGTVRQVLGSAGRHRALVGTGAAALALWLGRGAILRGLCKLRSASDDNETVEQE